MTRLDAETRRAVRDAQMAYVRRWLDGEEAESAFVRALSHVRTTCLSKRLSELVDPASLEALLDASLDPERLDVTMAPAVVAFVDEVARRASLREERASDLLGSDAVRAIEAVAREPGATSPAVVRAILGTRAVEDAASALLFEALDGFSRKVNPFVAEWGLPALVDALPLLARGTVKGALGGFQSEFERRLEPEIRRFLATFVRRTLERTARDMAEKSGDPEVVRLRVELANAVLSVPLEDLVWSPDSGVGSRALDAVKACVRGLGRSDAFRAELRQGVTRALVAEETLEARLARLGIVVPDEPALARALWPAVRGLLRDDTIIDALGAAIDESLAPLA